MQTEKSGQEYLEQVLACLEKRLEEVNASIEAGVREIEDMHEYYWENYTEMDQYGYEEFDNRQALLAQVNANQEQLLLRKRFRNMQDSPFFGRVDFIYQGDEEPEQFYIGQEPDKIYTGDDSRIWSCGIGSTILLSSSESEKGF